MSANERQVGGAHYQSAFQHWDLVWMLGMDYFLGCATAYVVRHKEKDGARDLEKAAHFLQKRIELAGNPSSAPAHPVTAPVLKREQRAALLEQFFAANPHLGDEERVVVRAAGQSAAPSAEDLQFAVAMVQRLLENYGPGQSAPPSGASPGGAPDASQDEQ
jgi:hypothetical protein